MSVSKLTKIYLSALCLIALLIFLLGVGADDLYFRKAVFFASAGLLVYAGVLYQIFLKRVFKPLEHISDGLNRLSAGDLDFNFSYNAEKKDELSLIAAGCVTLAKQIRDNREFTDSLIGSFSDAVFAVDKGGQIISVNERLKEITGIAEAKWVGVSLEALIPENEKERLKNAIAKAFKNEAAFDYELALTPEKNREFLFSFNILPVKKEGHPASVIFIGREPGGYKRLEEELKRTREEALEASEKLKKTIREIDDLALLAVRRELKMQDIRERFQRLREEQENVRKFTH